MPCAHSSILKPGGSLNLSSGMSDAGVTVRRPASGASGELARATERPCCHAGGGAAGLAAAAGAGAGAAAGLGAGAGAGAAAAGCGAGALTADGAGGGVGCVGCCAQAASPRAAADIQMPMFCFIKRSPSPVVLTKRSGRYHSGCNSSMRCLDAIPQCDPHAIPLAIHMAIRSYLALDNCSRISSRAGRGKKPPQHQTVGGNRTGHPRESRSHCASWPLCRQQPLLPTLSARCQQQI